MGRPKKVRQVQPENPPLEEPKIETPKEMSVEDRLAYALAFKKNRRNFSDKKKDGHDWRPITPKE